MPSPSLQQQLLYWYQKNRRDLPWRNTEDPYRIWISEVMLQQTRVSTVIPYFERFLKRFPNIRTLAMGRESSVLKAWEGLGYYHRARNLQSAARELVAKYEERLPTSSGELQKLPGFGPYTSAAVSSIAFGEPIAVVDGNVRRVLSRLFETKEKIETVAQDFLDPTTPGDFNQAVMELGALICLPQKPLCSTCPLSVQCLAHTHHTVHLYPPPRVKPTVTKIWAMALVVEHRNHYLLYQRPQKGRWGGMWEFPTVEDQKPFAIDVGLKQLTQKIQFPIQKATPAGSFRHQLSHQEIHVQVLRGKPANSTHRTAGAWITRRKLQKLPLSRLQSKIVLSALQG